MSKIIEKLDELIIPLLELVDAGNRNNKAVKRWEDGKHEFMDGLLAAQWTKVEDGLPEDGVGTKYRVWIHYQDQGKDLGDGLEVHARYWGRNWRQIHNPYCLIGRVTHWQPITAPGE